MPLLRDNVYGKFLKKSIFYVCKILNSKTKDTPMLYQNIKKGKKHDS